MDTVDYGPFAGMIGHAGALLAATAALLLGWRRGAKWEPSDEDLPRAAKQAGGLLSAVAVAFLWAASRESVGLLPLIPLKNTLIVLAASFVLTLVLYGVMTSVLVYAGKTPGQRVVCGMWLRRAVRKEERRKRSPAKRQTLKQLLEQSKWNLDALFSPLALGVSRQMLLICYLGVTLCGTTSLCAASLLVELASRPHVTSPPHSAAFDARERESIRAELLAARLSLPSSPPEGLRAFCDARLERLRPFRGWSDLVDGADSQLSPAVRLAAALERLGEPGAGVAPFTLGRRCRVWPEELEASPTFRGWIAIGSLFQVFNKEYLDRSVELAISEVNAQGGLWGRRLCLFACSTNETSDYDAFTSDTAAAKLSADLANTGNVVAIVGEGSSGRTAIAYDALSGLHVPLISPGATSTQLRSTDAAALSSNDGVRMFWRTIAPDSLQGQVLALLLERLPDYQGSGIGLVFQAGLYGEGLVNALSENLAIRHRQNSSVPQIVFSRQFRGTFQLSEALRAMRTSQSGRMTYLFISSSGDDYRRFLTELQASVPAGEDGSISVVLPDAGCIRNVLRDVRPTLLARIHGTRPAGPETADFESFRVRFDARFGVREPSSTVADSPYTGHAYDAAWLAIYATAYAQHHAGYVSGLEVARGVQHVVSPIGTRVVVGPNDLPQGLRSIALGEDIGLVGVVGPIRYNSDGETCSGFQIWGVRDGEIITIQRVSCDELNTR